MACIRDGASANRAVDNLRAVGLADREIITFELTMLGAIIATVTTLAVTAFIGDTGKLYDPRT